MTVYYTYNLDISLKGHITDQIETIPVEADTLPTQHYLINEIEDINGIQSYGPYVGDILLIVDIETNTANKIIFSYPNS